MTLYQLSAALIAAGLAIVWMGKGEGAWTAPGCGIIGVGIVAFLAAVALG